MALPLAYHWRSLFVRKTPTVLTVMVVASVVAVFAWIMGFAEALRASLAGATSDQKLIVLKPGATAESNSAIPIDEFNNLSQLTGVAVADDSGESLVSPEMLTQVALPRVRDAGRTSANVAVRGVMPGALQVHEEVRIAAGRAFNPGPLEVIVGVRAAEQFAGLSLGESVHLGYGENRPFEVVGHFTADGGPMESEIWGYLPTLQSAFNRTMYSSVYLRLDGEAAPRTAIEQIEGPAIQLAARTEKDYWDEQAQLIRRYLVLVLVLVGIMALAAVFSIANTMYSAVAGRTREIAMLRTVGFSERQIVGGFVLESVLLSLLGGALGCAACGAWLAAIGNTKDMFGATTFTTLAFEIRLSPLIVAASLLLVAVVGVLGALMPARRAARMEVVAALREP